MGLFSTLSIGTRGLAASQLGMDIAGQNISNADVEGYSRKRLNLASQYRRDDSYGQMGFGVDVINIQRMRDVHIDEQIQRQNEQLGYYKELDYTLERIENIFTEPSDSGLLNFMDQFFDAWQNVVNNPSDLSARTMVRTQAEMLSNVFHNVAGELNDLRQGMNQALSVRVDRVNQLAKEIFNLNQEIATVETRNQNANDSRDKRDGLLKELATLVDVSVTENQQGQISVSVGGSLLVSPVYFQELETTTTTFRQSDGTTLTNIGVRFKNSKRDYTPLGGEIKGIFECRDIIIPGFQEKLDILARSLVEKVNEQHERGFTLMGYTGISFFDPAVTGASDIGISASIRSDVKNIAAAQGGTFLAATAITTIAGQLDFGNAPQQLSKSLGRLWDSTIPDPPDQRARNIARGTVVVNAGGALLTEGADYHINYVLGTIQMLHNGYDGQALDIDFQYTTNSFGGPGDNRNALAIAQLRDALTMEPNVIGDPTSTFTEYYSSFIGKLGLNRNEAESNLETRRFLIEQYQTQQDAISGVSLDEEMADLIKFQHTYQAAARLISITSQMLDVLLNM